MSRGRPRHQSSRRRSYSQRQREIRERQLRITVDARPFDEESAHERETRSDLESLAPWQARLSGRASAA
ncbi:MAG: hypothetical protein M3O78_01650 [Chloroflexota bacterium]|nr:hypothetical protein [Chloroflexota bacterium]